MNCIITSSGLKVSLDKPDPATITIGDIAHHLSRIARFNGATKWPYSVAEHSILVSRIVSPRLAMDGLLHDATEAYLGDVSTPIKRLLPSYLEMESKFQDVISEKFGVGLCEEVKMADRAALFAEWSLLLPGGELGVEPYSGSLWEQMLDDSHRLLNRDFLNISLNISYSFTNHHRLAFLRAYETFRRQRIVDLANPPDDVKELIASGA